MKVVKCYKIKILYQIRFLMYFMIITFIYRNRKPIERFENCHNTKHKHNTEILRSLEVKWIIRSSRTLLSFQRLLSTRDRIGDFLPPFLLYFLRTNNIFRTINTSRSDTGVHTRRNRTSKTGSQCVERYSAVYLFWFLSFERKYNIKVVSSFCCWRRHKENSRAHFHHSGKHFINHPQWIRRVACTLFQLLLSNAFFTLFIQESLKYWKKNTFNIMTKKMY